MVYKVCHTLCVVPRTLYDVKYNVQYTHCTTYSTNSFSSNIVRSKYPKYVCYTVCVVPRTVQTPPLPIYWSYLVMSKYSYFVCHTLCVVPGTVQTPPPPPILWGQSIPTVYGILCVYSSTIYSYSYSTNSSSSNLVSMQYCVCSSSYITNSPSSNLVRSKYHNCVCTTVYVVLCTL